MKKIIRITAIFAVLITFSIGTQSFLKPLPEPAPQGTTIKLLYSGANIGSLIEVQFWGSVYSQGQDQWDEACPWYGNGSSNPVYFNCEDFYYRDGRVVCYGRATTNDPWTYKGDMWMSSTNCTMDGSKVTMFTVDCRYLYIPEN